MDPPALFIVEVVLVTKRRLQHVYFRYNNNDAYALNDINCTFLQNKKYAIMGPSGSGKSTLAKVISGMYRNYEGNILYDGKELCNMSHAESTHVIETIPQNPFIFNGTVYENIGLESIKVTVDGARNIHNGRRPYKNGNGTYDISLDKVQ